MNATPNQKCTPHHNCILGRNDKIIWLLKQVFWKTLLKENLGNHLSSYYIFISVPENQTVNSESDYMAVFNAGQPVDIDLACDSLTSSYLGTRHHVILRQGRLYIHYFARCKLTSSVKPLTSAHFSHTIWGCNWSISMKKTNRFNLKCIYAIYGWIVT